MRNASLTVIALCATLPWVGALSAKPTLPPPPNPQTLNCQQRKLAAQGALELCLPKNRANILGGKPDGSAACQQGLTKAPAQIDEVAAKQGTACRYVDNGDRTVSEEPVAIVRPMADPLPPQFPRDFQWEGRYIVRDLVPPVDVPFTWQGNDGNGQMTAGGEEYPIHFTNLIYDNELYTKTYKWPGTVPPKSDKCVCLGGLTLDQLNACLSSSRYVGAEILKDKNPRHVHHFRISVVSPVFLPPNTFFTTPIMEGDFYVDKEDSSKFWKVLHFGFQNLLDPALDEWIVMQEFKDTAGEVTLPDDCNPDMCPPHAFPPGFFCK